MPELDGIAATKRLRSLPERLIARFTDDTPDAPRVGIGTARGLSDREREVAVEVGRGASNSDVAARLYMSEANAKAHVSR